ncbi:acetyl-CoA carboxylase biotin carboxyl carrier protein [Embleya scabrispora]|uniref:acetyl-CoA carboxylase biotin carboxyl carrier protein n=1 Tax=Embleya scabrispora TaxID=159449 RepID=UPI00037B6EFB|nr:acetyl-CoA carboxylase biotin carboxyl carrier protein [Embleya scabrispora]MYS80884.1 acetyl-CoA carboxylase biotin carboxyl carrier protein [Streptomyces sp. SID5474]
MTPHNGTPEHHGTPEAREAHADDHLNHHSGYADERWVKPLNPAHAAQPHPQSPAQPADESPQARTAPVPPRWIRLRCGDTSVEIEWPEPPATGPAPVASGTPAAAPRVEQSVAPEGTRRFVCAPMVGTFYHAPEVGAKPFVSVGDTVRSGQTVGILEIMKMMNTITADVSGQVVEVLVPDAQPVEYQEPLIAIEPRAAGRDASAEQDGGPDERPGTGRGGPHTRQ